MNSYLAAVHGFSLTASAATLRKAAIVVAASPSAAAAAAVATVLLWLGDNFACDTNYREMCEYSVDVEAGRCTLSG